MKFINDKINFSKLSELFLNETPFNHVVIDDFLKEEAAEKLASEFPDFNSKSWHEYLNPIEIKRTCNNWNVFPETTYDFFTHLCSQEFATEISKLTKENLFPDPGLNGGGWHTHKKSGKLNAHLDYSIHPKLKLERKLNIIIYISKEWKPEWGGGLGLWSHDEESGSIGELKKTIDCIFNRAVIFDTTQNSWHGLPDQINCPKEKTRNSLAVYYVRKPSENAPQRGKALFVPTKEQEGNKEILDLIKKRSDINLASRVYNKKSEN